jgi:hypothetical protein
MGTMTNEITPPVSSVTQHHFASDKKETSLALVALKCEMIESEKSPVAICSNILCLFFESGNTIF